ncbi:MAG: endonuclease III domain-containing protein [Verrucomicrobiota bacterium]
MKKTPIMALRRAYPLMRARFGHLQWWPGETPFEVCIGAILTQNTSWSNVERAIANLKKAGTLTPQAMYTMPELELAQLIRPSGYYNLKANRLRAFIHVLMEEYGGDLQRFFLGCTADVRQRLLAIHGIGRETADSMLLYAGEHASFVIDAYTKRIFTRHHWWQPSRNKHPQKHPPAKGTTAEEYESLKSLCEHALSDHPEDPLDYWQDYHAQLVMVGKHHCLSRQPQCADCPLAPLLPAWVS